MRRLLHKSGLRKIPVRYWISGVALIFTVVLWLLSHWQHQHYFTSIRTLIRLERGELAYLAPNAHGFRYPVWRMIAAGAVLAVCSAIYPLIRNVGVVCILAVVLNFLTCGTIIDNPYSVLSVFVFDIGLFVALLDWFATRRRKPPPPGICTKCGYDIRATLDRCPECGAAVPFRPKQSETLP